LSPEAARLASADPVMADLIAAHGEIERPSLGNDVYAALLRAIVGQQLSVRAAQAIYGRLLARFGGRPPTPAEVLADDPEELRIACGLSHAKVRYLRSLAEHVESGTLQLEHLSELDDDAATTELTAVKGIGTWSADMFLMFTLGRPDVLASGDLGIRQAVRRAYGLEAVPTVAEVEALGERWRPDRTLACLYLWASLDSAPV
jgi:DNA-3-methyladenine glycosylase II